MTICRINSRRPTWSLRQYLTNPIAGVAKEEYPGVFLGQASAEVQLRMFCIYAAMYRH
jgi:hypothetical protein